MKIASRAFDGNCLRCKSPIEFWMENVPIGNWLMDLHENYLCTKENVYEKNDVSFSRWNLSYYKFCKNALYIMLVENALLRKDENFLYFCGNCFAKHNFS